MNKCFTEEQIIGFLRCELTAMTYSMSRWPVCNLKY
jgi:hypothetical protein